MAERKQVLIDALQHQIDIKKSEIEILGKEINDLIS